jgi:isoquinoline 1-oxidoreductase beta subunit
MTVAAARTDISRRNLFTGALAGGFLFAFYVPVRAHAQASDTNDGKFVPNAFIRIERTGGTTLVMPQVEMGQGIYTAVAMILAEELDADYRQVVLQHAPPDEKLYANPLLGVQATGGSTSVRAFWMPLRKAGASARAMLVQAAADQWQVSPESCSTDKGTVVHIESGRKLSYADLIDAASKLTPPAEVRLKDLKNFTVVGRPLKRFDTPDKVNGRAVFGIDAMLPNLKFATVVACPVLGGKVKKVDDREAGKIPGVQKVIVLDDMVAVVGNHMWAAKKGLDALKIDWDEGANASVSTETIWEALRAASRTAGVVAKSVGNAGSVVGAQLAADYELPLLAHATMEPINATVHCKGDACEVWTGTQIMARVRSEAAKAAGVPVEKVTVHNHLLGGGFGRKLEPDMVVAAVRVAKQVDGPVKVVWTREEDIRHDVYRPAYRDSIAATLSGGKIIVWKHKVAGSAVLTRWLPSAVKNGIDSDAVDSAVDMPYDIPNLHVEHVRVEPKGLITGFWRGVGTNNNVFAIESFMDELAHKVGRDPVEFRRGMLDKNPRALAALNLAAEKSGWGKPLPPRVGRGVCLQPSFASFIATVIEAEVDELGEVQLRRVTSAVDTGIAVNPDTIRAQLEGGLIFGLTAALYGEITLNKGRVQQSNFNDYRMLRIDQAPKIDIHLIQSDEPPGGIGETGTTAGPPALRNAIYAATGVALRRLPIDRKLIAGKKA